MTLIRWVTAAIFVATSLPASAATSTPAPAVDDLRRAIWVACANFSPTADDPASAEQIAACDARRSGVLEELWRIGAGGDRRTAIEALGLVASWAPPARAQAALDRLDQNFADDEATAAALEVAYGESRAPAKRTTLEAMIGRSRSRAVAGSARYLLATETLQSSPIGAARRQALSELRQIVSQYGDLPTQLLGGGTPPRLSRVASALLFRTERLRIGAPLPPMTAHDLDGRQVSSAAFAGKVTLIDFWATWCPPCVAAMPKLRSVASAYRTRPFQIVSISGDDSVAPVRSFVTHSGNTWPQWQVGPSGTVSAEWSNSSFPFYILVDRHGKIVAATEQLPALLAKLPPLMQRGGRGKVGG